MKNKINLNQLSMSWNEKQKPQRFARYAGMLLMLLTLGVGQMWARTVYFDTDGLTFKSNATNFAIYLWGGGDGDEWHTLEHVSGNIYSAEVSDSRVNCIFCSMSSHTTGWNNKTGQTDDQKNFTSNNYFTVTSVNLSGNNDGKISGLWSLYSATPSVSLGASPTSVECGASVTFTATGNNLGGESATYKFEDITGGGSSVIQAASSTNTCTTSWATAGTKTVKVTMTVGEDEYTDTYDVTIVSYIYFYAAIPNSWDVRTTTVKLGNTSASILTPYDNTSLASATKNASSPCVPVYSSVESTSYYNNGAKYNVYIYKVLESNVGTNVYLGNNDNGWIFGTPIGTLAAGKLYTLTSGDNGGTYMTANAISVNSVSASGPYAINAVTLTSSISAYGTSTSNLRTAGGDTFTTIYILNDQTASTSTTITPTVENTYTSNTGNLAGSITIDPNDLTAGHNYTLTVTIADNITGKMTSSATSTSFTVSNPSYKVYYGVHESGNGTLAATYTSGGSSIGSSGSSVAYGSGLTFTATPSQTYYEVEGFYSDEDCTSSLQSGNTTTYTIASLSGETYVYVKFKLKDFTVTYNNMTGATNDKDNPSSVTYETAAVTLGDPEKTGYTFDGWYDNSSFTGNKVTTIPTHTTDNVSLWAKWTEKTYTVTLTNATPASVTAGIATTPSITAAAAPFGMTFSRWEVSGGASVASTTTNPTTVSATAAGEVTAVYTRSLYAYVEGRFHIASASTPRTWTNSFCSGNWDDDCTNIQFDYDEANHRFYLHTYATPKELSTKIDNNDPYFFIRTSTSNSSVTGGQEYHPSGSNQELTTVNEAKNVPTTTNTYNLIINNTSDNSYYVTLYFDGTKVWYDYSPAVINTINLSANRVPPGASITATPSMYYKGTSNKAYCWGIFTDEDCTEEVKTTFSSLGDGIISFSAPAVRDTYYLRLQIHSDATCASSVEAEKVVPFTVTTEDMVFFRNVPNWGSVHVYFLGTEAYWSGSDDGNKGSGCNGRDNGDAHGMTRIPNTNIFYYDYHGNSNVVFNGSGYAYIAFTDNYKPYSNNFSGCQAVYRGDFSTCAPMYVPENYITNYMNTSAGDGQAAYYNRGYWTKYMDTGSGFTLHVYASRTKNTDDEVFSHEMTGTPGSGTYTYTYNFSDDAARAGYSSYTYGFEVSGCGGSWYAVDGSAMTITNSDYWNMYTGTSGRGGVTIDAKTKHTFILTLTGDGHIQLSVDYPLSVGDYRLVYDDNTQTPHPSKIIRAQANSSDIASMFVRTSADVEPVLKVQRCTQVSPSIEWEDFEWRTGDATIDLSGLGDDVSGVYDFYIEQDENGDFSIDRIAPYSGLYYIRTNSVDGGWAGYKTDPDNIMTYAQYPFDKGYGFNYYKAKWVSPEGSNVTFTIANDYSDALCDTLMSDATVADATDLPQAANVRFGWNSTTNQMTRAYISGSTNVSDRFLVMIGDEKMHDKNGHDLTEDESQVEGLGEYEMNFSDLNNWIYRADIKVDAGAAVKLIAQYNDKTQYFIGAADKTETILGSESTGGPYLMRVTYDFKTNRLMTAWLPDGEIEADIDLRADMMLIRKGQEAATQITFSDDYSISNIKSIYGVMQFDYDDFVGKFPNWNAAHAYEFLMYYISFPFDVKVSEIFGAGVMGENWIVQKYNGAKRAQIGWFQETSTFWETLPADSIMHKHEGYLLLLDRVSFNDGNNAIWYKQGSGDAIYLYFPSMSNTIGTISEKETTIKVPSHRCGISRTFTVDGVAGTLNHMNTDSHWNIIGTPLFETQTATIGTPVAGGGETLQYFYEWDYDDNTLNARATLDDGVTFYTMHSYMVQYAGDITFSGSAITPPPASVAARRLPSDKQYRIELQMVNANGKASRTYVELRENACDTFALNEDMYMMRTSKTADLYSFAGSYDVAANVLSVKNHLVPVGVGVKRAGMYRFTMPSEFDGSVVLIDTYTGARTNLALGDYEVNLERGTANDRFLLEINIHNAPTTIEGIEGGSLKDGKAHKFVQDGVMYILRDGKIYDARGAKVK